MMKPTLERLRAEFLEMPGLRLTVAQARRLFGVEPSMCQAILDALADAKFLRAEPDGSYARLTDGDLHRRRLATADIETRLVRKAS